MKAFHWRIVLWAALLVCFIGVMIFGIKNGDMIMTQMESSTL